jgi:hypothetical protein
MAVRNSTAVDLVRQLDQAVTLWPGTCPSTITASTNAPPSDTMVSSCPQAAHPNVTTTISTPDIMHRMGLFPLFAVRRIVPVYESDCRDRPARVRQRLMPSRALRLFGSAANTAPQFNKASSYCPSASRSDAKSHRASRSVGQTAKRCRNWVRRAISDAFDMGGARSNPLCELSRTMTLSLTVRQCGARGLLFKRSADE